MRKHSLSFTCVWLVGWLADWMVWLFGWMDDMDVRALRAIHIAFSSLQSFVVFLLSLSFHSIWFCSVVLFLFCFDASWVCRYCVFTWPYFILDVFPHSSFFIHSLILLHTLCVCLLWMLQFPFSGVLCLFTLYVFSSSFCIFRFIYFIRIVYTQFIFSVSSLLYCFLFDFCIIFCFSLVDSLVAVAFVSLCVFFFLLFVMLSFLLV